MSRLVALRCELISLLAGGAVVAACTGVTTTPVVDAGTEPDADVAPDADADPDDDDDDDGSDATPDSSTDAASDSSADSAPDADAALGCPEGSGEGPLGGARPTALKVPAGYDPSRSYPLVIELHGRGARGIDAERVFEMGVIADDYGLFVIAPDGSLDEPPPPTEPATFWNATDGCCNLYGSTVDDVAYLRSLICHTEANYSIDPNRVYIIGQSNGGFMAHRMACDASDLVTAIISIAGVTWLDPTNCRPTHPVSVLQIHGTADTVVWFDGMEALAPGPTPSAQATYETWAALNGCTGADTAGPIVDFDESVAGNETVTVSKPLIETCRVRTEFWAVVGGGHAPSTSDATKLFFLSWFLATPPNH